MQQPLAKLENIKKYRRNFAMWQLRSIRMKKIKFKIGKHEGLK